MSAFTITVRNTLGVFGMGPANRWNAVLWGSFLWGDAADIPMVVRKLTGSTTTPDTGFIKSVQHYLAAQTTTLDSTPSKGVTRTLAAQGVTVLAETTSEGLLDGAGYHYLFPDRVSDADLRSFATWTKAAASAATWTTAGLAATTWSET